MLLNLILHPHFTKSHNVNPPTHCFTDVGVGIDVCLRWFHKLIPRLFQQLAGLALNLTVGLKNI